MKSRSIIAVLICAGALSAAAAERIPGGILLSPRDLVGGNAPRLYSYMCPERLAVPVMRSKVGPDAVSATFRLERSFAAPVMLAVVGLDDDKPGVSSFALDVNGREVFSGPNRFPDTHWRAMVFSLSDGLPEGKNTLRIRNTTPPTPSRSELFPDDPEQGAADPRWGWICFHEIRIHDFTGEFRRLASGEPGSAWRSRSADGVLAGAGVLRLRGEAGARPGIGFDTDTPEKAPLTAPGMWLRFTVRMAGRGRLLAVVRHYNAKGSELDSRTSAVFMPLADDAQGRFAAEIEMPSRSRAFWPEIVALGPCDLTVSDLAIEVLPGGGQGAGREGEISEK